MTTSDETIRAWHKRINDGLLRTGQITHVEHGERLTAAGIAPKPKLPPPTDDQRSKHLERAREVYQAKIARQHRLLVQVASKLRRARVELGMTREQVGHVIDRSARTIRAIECAEHSTDVDNIRELCLELGVEFPEEYDD